MTPAAGSVVVPSAYADWNTTFLGLLAHAESGRKRIRGANVSGEPVRSYQFVAPNSSWSAAEPGCVITSARSSRSGRSSVKPPIPGLPLRYLGREILSAAPRSPRHVDSLALLTIGPPGTLS